MSKADGTMSVRNFRRALQAAKAVFAWTSLFPGDAVYLQVQKQSVAAAIKGVGRYETVNAVMRSDGDLYIN